MEDPTDPRPLRILVVDDDAFTLELMRDMLDLAGMSEPECTIATEADPARGLEVLAALKPDLLICDLSMPGLDGIEFLNEAARTRFAGHVMLLSGMDGGVRRAAERLASAQGLKVLGAYRKPIELNELRAALAPVLLGLPKPPVPA
jgi:CheY-like chemotaxis protein